MTDRDGAVPANQQTVRQHNRALVLNAVADRAGRTRAQVALELGLTRATVSAIVDEFVTAHTLVERAPTPGLRGRPGSRLELNPHAAAAIGVEIDVDRTSACLVDFTGVVRDRRVALVDNATSPPGVALRRTARLVHEFAVDAPVTALAVAFPGLVSADGVVLRAPNLPRWQGLAPATRLHELTGMPVLAIDNEANLSALAEHRRGCGRPDFVHVSGEAGVGGGIVLGGTLFRGVRGFAGELGHITVDPRGPRCGCGNRGCLETLAGRRALLDSAGVADEAELVTRAERGGVRAQRALRAGAAALAIAVAAAINTFDLPAVVLGGCYARLGRWLAEPFAEELAPRVVSGAPVEVLASELGPDAAMLGAATEVLRAMLHARTTGVTVPGAGR